MSVNPRINITTINSIETKTAYFNGVRYYDPSLQRFLGEDPIGFDSKDFNFYRYVENDPINFIDSNGKNKFGDWVRDKLGGEGKEKARKTRFCQECKNGFDHNLSDRQICDIYITEAIKWCGTDGSCRVQYTEFMRDGCNKTCGK